MSDEKYRQIADRIASHVRHTVEYCQGVTMDAFLADRKLQEACVFNVLQIGELAARVIELKLDQEHPEIMWRQMRGMRNKIVYDYDGVRLAIVWDTIQNDFPELLLKL